MLECGCLTPQQCVMLCNSSSKWRRRRRRRWWWWLVVHIAIFLDCVHLIYICLFIHTFRSVVTHPILHCSNAMWRLIMFVRSFVPLSFIQTFAQPFAAYAACKIHSHWDCFRHIITWLLAILVENWEIEWNEIKFQVKQKRSEERKNSQNDKSERMKSENMWLDVESGWFAPRWANIDFRHSTLLIWRVFVEVKAEGKTSSRSVQHSIEKFHLYVKQLHQNVDALEIKFHKLYAFCYAHTTRPYLNIWDIDIIKTATQLN